ncbi:MAG TPA: ATP-binding protein, partial [Vicinamibacterales bacterium]|nr:ATP-binding protein [Vicinamibacterales bacterium]
GDQAIVEVHDSGAGINEETSRTLFEPAITFKKHGMGLGLLIARKNALVLGGDITLVRGELGGAGFRVTLPAAQDSPGSRGVPPSHNATADKPDSGFESPGRRSAEREGDAHA